MDEQSQSQPINSVPMGPEHIETLARLEQVCFSSPWSFDALAGELSDPLAVFRVATVNGQVAGYVGMQHILDEGYICNIAVFPEYRRRGVATALLHALDAYAKENGMASISLEVRQSNEAAQRLYSRFDFETVGRRNHFYQNPTEDALIMTRTY